MFTYDEVFLYHTYSVLFFLASLAYSTKDFLEPLYFSEDKLSKVSINNILAIIGDDMDMDVWVDK